MDPPPPGVSPSNVPENAADELRRFSLFIIARLGSVMRIDCLPSAGFVADPDWLMSSVRAKSADHDEDRLDAVQGDPARRR